MKTNVILILRTMGHFSCVLLFVVCGMCIYGCDIPGQDSQHGDTTAGDTAVVVSPVITDTLVHDTSAFTQGLALYEGKLYESTGLYGQSKLRIIDTATGIAESEVALDDKLFGEGLALHNRHALQLTWKAQMALRYSLVDLTVRDTLHYKGEGWGLTVCNGRYVMSDGSHTLTLRGDDFGVRATREVYYNQARLTRLNELECIDGLVYANVWYSDYIFAISLQQSPARVVRVIDCSELVLRAEVQGSDDAVLNGIAWDPQRRRAFVTGKRWPLIFVVSIDRGHRGDGS